ncbi:MAG: hypothetical protein JNM75_06535 [Rhodospirillales bacterium]|nr:hypothetical protein [Rhodospirillales bacterium]
MSSDKIHLFRIFLSSPGDVATERDLARALIKDVLPVEPFIRNKTAFDVISWDDPHASVAMPAHLTPQEAVNRGLPKPCECDIVVVIMWGRMGTPLSPDFKKENGEPYLSGTEWEYENAIAAARQGGNPIVLLYRCAQQPVGSFDDPELNTKLEQYRKVQGFFARFSNPDGSFGASVHSYATPEQFRDQLYQHLKDIVHRLLEPGTDLAKAATAPAFQSRIQAFLDEYLKSEAGPVPFGGRDHELGCLDTWLADDGQPARFLLTAPAGRGKSALLVRWIDRLKNTGAVGAEGWQLVFVPISIRGGTNAQRVFYQALAERLAMITGQRLEQPAMDAAGFYADKVRDLLTELVRSGRRVLVVLDGVDEALRGEFDATIVPRILCPTVRIVISARWQLGDTDSAGWQQRLDWRWDVKCRALDLDKLDRAAIGDVLVKMGAPLDVVAADQALVDRLAELTEGEPLPLRFYATDLWHKGEEGVRITRADLDNLRPGFGPYFDRWLQHQQKAWRDAGESVDQKTVEAVLAVLSYAFGPLEGGDVLRLASFVSGSAPPLSAQVLLEPLRRFVIGDGSADHGYVLSHPKIGEYLQQERFRDAVSTIAAAFVAWGRDVVAKLNAAAMKRANAPRYLLQFYSRHLQDCAEATPQDFLAMVNDGWRRAWEHLEGGQQGFANDVRVAWTIVRKDDPLADLGAQLRCALTLSSIRSLGHNVPSELILAAVQQEVISINHAAHLACFMSNRGDCVRTLALLASEVETDPERKAALLTDALAAARAIGNVYYRAEVLSGLAGHLPAEQLGDALAAARAIGNEDARVEALSGLAGHLSAEQREEALRDALAAARAIGGEGARARALGGLAGHLSGEQLGDALAAATAIGDEDARAEALGGLAGHLSAGQLGDALAAAKAIGAEYHRAWALSGLAGHLSAAQLGDALAAARAIGDEESRTWALGGLAGHLSGAPREEALRDALAAARAIGGEGARARALGGLAGHLSGEQLGDALAAARAIGNKAARTRALSGLAGHLSAEQLRDALAAAKAIGSEHTRAEALSGLAGHLSGAQREEALRDALAAATAIGGEFARARALSRLAGHLSGEQLGDALAAARAIGNENSRARALSGLAGRLFAEQREEALRDALAAATAIGNERARAEALGGLAGHLSAAQLGDALAAATAIGDEDARTRALSGLAGHLSAGQLGDALAAATAIGDEDARTRALGGLAGHLSGAPREEALRDALAAARAIGDEDARAEALGGLAGHLSGAEREEALRDALAAATAIVDEDARARALGGLAGHLSSEQLGDALAAAKAIGDEDARARALRGLAGHLSSEQLGDALAAAKAIGDAYYRARALSGLAGHLSAEQREEALRDALAAAKAIGNEESRAWALCGLAGHLSAAQREEALRDALAAATAIDNEIYRAWALGRLAGHLSAEQLGEALAAAKAIGAEVARAEALDGLAGHLSAAQLGEALAAAKAIGDEGARAVALSGLAGHLSAAQLGDALAAAMSIGDEKYRAWALGGLAGHLSAEQREEALISLLEIGDRLTRPTLLSAIRDFAPIIAEFGGTDALVTTHVAICDTAGWYA